VVVEMQVVVEEGVDVVRSGAVGPLDADAIMFSDPNGELADDTGVQVALRKVVLLLLLHGEAPRAGRAAVSVVRPTQGQNFFLLHFAVEYGCRLTVRKSETKLLAVSAF
jgi:hypothetical protein